MFWMKNYTEMQFKAWFSVYMSSIMGKMLQGHVINMSGFLNSFSPQRIYLSLYIPLRGKMHLSNVTQSHWLPSYFLSFYLHSLTVWGKEIVSRWIHVSFKKRLVNKEVKVSLITPRLPGLMALKQISSRNPLCPHDSCDLFVLMLRVSPPKNLFCFYLNKIMKRSLFFFRCNLSNISVQLPCFQDKQVSSWHLSQTSREVFFVVKLTWTQTFNPPGKACRLRGVAPAALFIYFYSFSHFSENNRFWPWSEQAKTFNPKKIGCLELLRIFSTHEYSYTV